MVQRCLALKRDDDGGVQLRDGHVRRVEVVFCVEIGRKQQEETNGIGLWLCIIFLTLPLLGFV